MHSNRRVSLLLVALLASVACDQRDGNAEHAELETDASGAHHSLDLSSPDDVEVNSDAVFTFDDPAIHDVESQDGAEAVGEAFDEEFDLTAQSDVSALASCVKYSYWQTTFYRYVRIYNGCSSKQRAKVRIASWPDSPCYTISPGTSVTHRWRRGIYEHYLQGVTSC